MAPTIMCAPEVLIAFGRNGNGNRKLPVRTAIVSPEDDGDVDCDPCQFERQIQLAACNDCENTLQLAHAIASGEVSCGDIAKATKRTRGEAHRWGQRILQRIGRTLSLADAAIAAISEDASGFTIDPAEATRVRGMDVFTVSLFGHETRFADRPDRLQITSYVAAHFEAIFERNGRYLGGWHDEERNEFCLDVTKLFPSEDKAAALRFARLHKQKAITNLLTFEVVWLQDRRRRAA